MLLGFILLVPAVAGAQALTGSLFGTVSDASAARLPGVTVTVESPQLITGREVQVTGEKGSYLFPVLPPGDFSITFELSGFQTVKREGIALLANQALAVDVTLAISSMKETVIVPGQAPLIDTRSAAITNAADTSTLQNVPLSRNFQQILNIMPGVTGGQIVHGGTARQNVFSLDGVNTNDPNTNTPVTELPTDAFQEVQVTTAGIPAEFGNGSGGVFNYITRSGGNEFSGAASFFYQSKGLQSNNVSADLRKQGIDQGGLRHNYDGGGVLGGPIRRNRVWFFTTLRHVDQTTLPVDFGQLVFFKDTQSFSKATVQAWRSSRVEGSFYLRDNTTFPGNAAFRTAAEPRTWFGLAQRDYLSTARWTAVLGSRTVLEGRGSAALDTVNRPMSNYVSAPLYQDQQTGLVSGGDIQQNSFNGRRRYNAKADLAHFHENWLGGTHSLKAGFGWEKGPSEDRRFLIFARGANELDEGCADAPRCVSPVPDTLHLLFNGTPFRVRLFNTPRIPHYETGSVDVYGQDQWVIRDRYTLSLGIRYERISGRLPESQGGGGRWDRDVVVFPSQDLVALNTVAPRLGFVWDVAGDHLTTVKASYGRFYYQITNFQFSNVSPAAASGYREYDWADRNANGVYDPGEEGVLRQDTRPDLSRLPMVDPNTKDQYNDVWTVGFERTLGGQWAFSATGIFKHEGNLLGIVDALIPVSAYNPIVVRSPLTGEPLTIYTLRTEFRGRQGQTIFTNPGNQPGDPAKLERKYRGLEVVLRRRLQGHFQLETSYVLGKGQGNVGNGFSESNFFFYTNPNNLVNAYGDLALGPLHQFKAQGIYHAPYGVTLSGFFQALSGVSVNDNSGPTRVKGAATGRFFKTDYPQMQSETFIDAAVEPSGTRKFDPFVQLDFRVEKTFPTSIGQLAITVDAFNLLNAGVVTAVRELRLDAPNFNVPAALQGARQLRLAARWTF